MASERERSSGEDAIAAVVFGGGREGRAARARSARGVAGQIVDGAEVASGESPASAFCLRSREAGGGERSAVSGER